MNSRLILAAGLIAATTATGAAAQDAVNWTGPYVGGRVGYGWITNSGDERLRFDTDLDGGVGNTVRTGTGANAFSPGFCGGYAKGPTAAEGCGKDKKGVDFAIHAGYDFQDEGQSFVYGIVVEVGSSGAKDAVGGFSTTPAFYTMERKVKYDATLRGRAGYAFGKTLVYGTAGGTWAKVRNRFTTSNGANAFSDNGNENAWGFKVGGGAEHMLAKNISIGVLYLYSNLDADDFTVRSGNSGTTPATNPFLLDNAAGTDIKRSFKRFDQHSVSLTASLRF